MLSAPPTFLPPFRPGSSNAAIARLLAAARRAPMLAREEADDEADSQDAGGLEDGGGALIDEPGLPAPDGVAVLEAPADGDHATAGTSDDQLLQRSAMPGRIAPARRRSCSGTSALIHSVERWAERAFWRDRRSARHRAEKSSGVAVLRHWCDQQRQPSRLVARTSQESPVGRRNVLLLDELTSARSPGEAPPQGRFGGQPHRRPPVRRLLPPAYVGDTLAHEGTGFQPRPCDAARAARGRARRCLSSSRVGPSERSASPGRERRVTLRAARGSASLTSPALRWAGARASSPGLDLELSLARASVGSPMVRRRPGSAPDAQRCVSTFAPR